MKNKPVSLRTNFLLQIFITLLIIVGISGVIQIYFLNNQLSNDVDNKSDIISKCVKQGIDETKLASQSIEHQIDLRMESYSKQIADRLGNQSLENISTDELIKIKDDLGLTGITLFARKGNDIVGVKSTDPNEIGFSFKKVGYPKGYKDFVRLFNHQKVVNGPTYATPNMYVLPITQSGSHSEKPLFFKYAYYHVPGSEYIINPYIKANEIYQFTKKVGPDSWIKKMIEKNNFIKEIAVLDPRVFQNPELETKLFPPLKKVIYGNYSYKDSKDTKILIGMAENKLQKYRYIKKYKNEKIYKLFIKTKDGQVIYIALDYGALSGPLYRHSIILLVTGVISLIVLFLLTARFFNRIYENIQKIKRQIQSLEKGDLTAKSNVNDRSELENLSQSTNRMVDKLNKLVKDTQEQATKTQKLSVLLEAEASQTVEKMYALSTETTMKSREQLDEIISFLDELVEILQPYKENEQVIHIIERAEHMKQIANERTAATTDMTITLSDLIESLHGQSSELSEIANALLESMKKFKL